MARSLLTDISEKLVKEELELEVKLESLKAKKATADGVRKQAVEAAAFSSHTATNFATQREQASKRNKALLKELQVQAAKLRSRTCFCPTELQVNRLQAQYVQMTTLDTGNGAA